MSHILITGGAGFIGSQIAYALFLRGDTVTLIDDFSYGKEDNLIFDKHDFRGEINRISICDRNALINLFKQQQFDYIYHIAAITPLPDCQINPGRAIEVNVAGTVNVLEAARLFGIKKVVFASTSAVYENTHEFPSAEIFVLPPTLIYSASKYAAEQMCRSYSEVYGMDITILRFANVYGPHVDCLRTQPPVVGYLIRELFFGRQPELHSTGEQKRDFIYVDDLVSLSLKIIEKTGSDTVNVSSNETHSINEMFLLLREIMKKTDITALYLKEDHYWKNYPELYKGAYPIKSNILSKEVNKYTLCDNTHAKEEYGWEPLVGFEEGLRRTVEYTLPLLEREYRNEK